MIDENTYKLWVCHSIKWHLSFCIIKVLIWVVIRTPTFVLVSQSGYLDKQHNTTTYIADMTVSTTWPPSAHDSATQSRDTGHLPYSEVVRCWSRDIRPLAQKGTLWIIKLASTLFVTQIVASPCHSDKWHQPYWLLHSRPMSPLNSGTTLLLK